MNEDLVEQLRKLTQAVQDSLAATGGAPAGNTTEDSASKKDDTPEEITAPQPPKSTPSSGSTAASAPKNTSPGKSSGPQVPPSLQEVPIPSGPQPAGSYDQPYGYYNQPPADYSQFYGYYNQPAVDYDPGYGYYNQPPEVYNQPYAYYDQPIEYSYAAYPPAEGYAYPYDPQQVGAQPQQEFWGSFDWHAYRRLKLMSFAKLWVWIAGTILALGVISLLVVSFKERIINVFVGDTIGFLLSLTLGVWAYELHARDKRKPETTEHSTTKTAANVLTVVATIVLYCTVTALRFQLPSIYVPVVIALVVIMIGGYYLNSLWDSTVGAIILNLGFFLAVVASSDGVIGTLILLSATCINLLAAAVTQWKKPWPWLVHVSAAEVFLVEMMRLWYMATSDVASDTFGLRFDLWGALAAVLTYIVGLVLVRTRSKSYLIAVIIGFAEYLFISLVTQSPWFAVAGIVVATLVGVVNSKTKLIPKSSIYPYAVSVLIGSLITVVYIVPNAVIYLALLGGIVLVVAIASYVRSSLESFSLALIALGFQFIVLLGSTFFEVSMDDWADGTAKNVSLSQYNGMGLNETAKNVPLLPLSSMGLSVLLSLIVTLVVFWFGTRRNRWKRDSVLYDQLITTGFNFLAVGLFLGVLLVGHSETILTAYLAGAKPGTSSALGTLFLAVGGIVLLFIGLENSSIRGFGIAVEILCLMKLVLYDLCDITWTTRGIILVIAGAVGLITGIYYGKLVEKLDHNRDTPVPPENNIAVGG